MATSLLKDADSAVSANDRAFITEGLALGCRLDGRGLHEFRKVRFEFALDDTSATVTLGSTRVLATISAELEAPFPDRASEGILRFNVECGPMASPAFEAGRPAADAVQLARLVERTLKQSGAVDCEALCVVAGRKVWSLRCDIHVLDHGGNLVDACVLAALAAVMVYRKPEVTVGGGDTGTDIVVHPREIREPLPLTIHHTPVSVTWALFRCQGSGGLDPSSAGAETVCVVDPGLKEQAAQAGSATFMVNTSDEVCGVHKAEGVGLRTEELMRLVQLSCSAAVSLVEALKQALKAHEVARVAARVRRTARNPFLVAADHSSRHVCGSDAGGQQAGSAAAPRPMSVDDEAGGSDDDDDDSEDDADGVSESESSEEEQAVAPSGSKADRAQPQRRQQQQGQPKAAAQTAQARPVASSGAGGARVGTLLAHTDPAGKATTTGTSGKPAAAKKASRPVPHAPPAGGTHLDDNLETIAALIAGGNSQQPQADLSAAVKQHNVKKAARAKKGQA